MDMTNFLKDASNIQICGIKLQNFDSKSLIINEDNFFEHLQKQSAGTAYYGSICKSLKQQLNYLIKQRQTKLSECTDRAMMALQKQSTRSSSKPTVRQAQTMALMSNSKLFEEYDKKIYEVEEKYNFVEQYYEAWKQKSFSLNNITNLVCAGFIKLEDGLKINTQNN